MFKRELYRKQAKFTKIFMFYNIFSTLIYIVYAEKGQICTYQKKVVPLQRKFTKAYFTQSRLYQKFTFEIWRKDSKNNSIKQIIMEEFTIFFKSLRDGRYKRTTQELTKDKEEIITAFFAQVENVLILNHAEMARISWNGYTCIYYTNKQKARLTIAPKNH